MADIELVIKLPKDIIEGAKSSPNYYPTKNKYAPDYRDFGSMGDL